MGNKHVNSLLAWKYRVSILLLSAGVLLPSFLCGQVIWAENFTYPAGTTTGANNNTANPAADWVATCASCVAGDWYDVQAGVLEGHDTNGPAVMETELIDISAYPSGVEVTMVLSEAGDLEGCPGGVSSGCNSIDWIQVQYSLNGGAYVDVSSAAGGPCSGSCAGDTYYTFGDFGTTNVRICPLVGGNLRLRVTVQTWAAGEYLRVDDIVVQGQTCVPVLAIDSVGHETCAGSEDGFIAVSGSGGLPPYQFSLNGGAFGSSSQFNNLAPGTYSVTQMDSNGATVTISGIVVLPGAQISTTDSIVHITCNGAQDGQFFALNTGGGQAPYQFSIDGSAFTANSSYSNLVAGPHQIVIQDQTGCLDTVNFSIVEPNLLVLSGSSTASACTTATGTATVTVSGGTPGYGYSWDTSPIQTTSTATALLSGLYQVIVTDSAGCLDTMQVAVQQTSTPVVAATGADTVCQGSASVQLFATAGNGTAPFSYTWSCSGPSCPLDSLNDDDPLASPSSTTVFFVQVTDAGGCVSLLDSVEVVVGSIPVANAGADTSVCPGSTVFLNGSGFGAGPFDFTWSCLSVPSCPLDSLNDDDPQAVIVAPMSFILLVTDDLGCESAPDTISVNMLPLPIAEAGFSDTICPGDTTQLLGSASNAGPVYAYNWLPAIGISQPGISTPQVYPLVSMWYSLQVTSNGCSSAWDSVWIEVEYAPSVDAGRDTVLCLGDAFMLIGMVNGTASSHLLEWTGPGGLLNPGGEDSLIIYPQASADYVLIAYPPAGCRSLPDTVHVEVELPFVHEAPAAPAACFGEPVWVGVQTQAGFVYEWSPKTGLDAWDVAMTQLIADSMRAYTLTITDTTKVSVNCREQEFPVLLAPSSCIFPNVITPNGDGINDVLFLGAYHHPVQLLIFDRWGVLVYESGNYQNDWDGTDQFGEPIPEGVYYYMVKANIMPSNSANYELGDYYQAYHVTLLR